MLDRTKRLVTAIALLAGLLVSLPIAQDRANANEIQTKTDTKIVTKTVAANKKYAKVRMIDVYGWDEKQYSCLISLWNRESGWRATAHNKSSGAYGIPQALPGKKMATEGADWKTNPKTQIRWGLKYIKSRYGTPCGAKAHSKRTGWY